MKLSINIVHRGGYVKAGDELPSDFVLPEHLDRFAIYDDNPPQTSRATSIQVEGVRLGGGSQLANSAVDQNSLHHGESYPAGEEEFTPKWRPKQKQRKENEK